MKRFFSAALAAALVVCALPAVRAEGGGPPNISAASAVLVDGETGRVLYEKDGHTPRLIASTTKLMTALAALESGHSLEEVVTIAPQWAGVEGSSIYLRPGEEITLETLLYGLLLRSGNDAALAIAGHCGGTVENFVAQMNRKARELGMENTTFSSIDEVDDISTLDEYQVALHAGLSPAEALKAVSRFSRDNARTPMQWDDGPQAGFTTGKKALIHETGDNR